MVTWVSNLSVNGKCNTGELKAAVVDAKKGTKYSIRHDRLIILSLG